MKSELKDEGKNGKRMSIVDRLIAQTIGDGRAVGSPEDPAAKLYPELWELLSQIYVGRDYVKTPASFTVKLGPGGVVVTLTDKDMKLGVDVGCTFLADVLSALEAALTNPNTTFKNWGKGEPHLRKRRAGS